MDRYKFLSVGLAGVILGMACGDQIKDAAEDTAAAASPSDCEQWDFKYVSINEDVPAGWEPFAGADVVFIRRCED